MDINSSMDFQEDPMVISCLYPQSQLNNDYKTPESSSRADGGDDMISDSHQRLANTQKRTNNYSHFSTAAAAAAASAAAATNGNHNQSQYYQTNYNNGFTTFAAMASPSLPTHMNHAKSVMNNAPRHMDTLTNLRGQLRSNATMASPRNMNGNGLLHGRKKKPKQSKMSFFSTLKWKKMALKWMSHTSFSRFKKITSHQFQLINDKASSFLIRKYPLVTQSTTTGAEQVTQSNIDDHHLNKKLSKGNTKLRSIHVNIIEMFVNLKQLEWCDLELKWMPVFSPTGSFRFAWDLVILFVIVAFMFMIPIAISFDIPLQEMFNQGLLQACNSILIIDIILNWNFGYFEKGLPIMKRSQIVRYYLFNGFLIDMSSCTVLAIDVFFMVSIASNYLHLLFFLKISSINGIFKKIEERFHLTPKVTQISSLIQLLFLIVTVTHLFACMWIAVSRSEQLRGVSFWLQKMNFDPDDWLAQYICSYYFSTVTMITVGYGDFSPVNNTERIVGILAMLISCVVFAYSLNAIGEIFSLIASKRKQLQADIFLINNFMTKKNINERLQYEVREFLEYTWQMTSDRNPEKETMILNQLNPQLKEKLLAETYSMILRGYKTFRENFSEQFVTSLTDIIEESTFRPDQWMTAQENETKFSDDLFFLESGKAVVCEEESPEKTIHSLAIGEAFGDIAFFSGQPYELHVKAIEYTTVLRIRRHRFIALISTFPHDYEIFKNIQDRILYANDLSAINIRCFSCSSNLHAYRQCKHIHFVPESLPVIKRFVRSEWSSRDPMERRTFRFPTLLLHLMAIESMMRFELAQCDAIAQYIDQHLNVNQEEEEEQEQEEDGDCVDDGCFESDDCIEEEDEVDLSKSTSHLSSDAMQFQALTLTAGGTVKRESLSDQLSASNKDTTLNQQHFSLVDPTLGQQSLSQLRSKVFISQHSLTNPFQSQHQTQQMQQSASTQLQLQQQQVTTDNSISSKVIGQKSANITLTNIPEFDHLDSIRMKSPIVVKSVSNGAGQFLTPIPLSSSSPNSSITNSGGLIGANSQRKKKSRTSLLLQPSIRRYEIQPTQQQKTSTILEGDSSQDITDGGRYDSFRGKEAFGVMGVSSTNVHLFSNKQPKFQQIVAEIAQAIVEKSQQANEKQQPQQQYSIRSEEQFEEQRNFDFYLPQNNLSEILSFLRFKRRMLKSMKVSARQSMAAGAVHGNTNFAIASEQFIKSTFQITQSALHQQQQQSQQQPISDYLLLRKFEQQNNAKQAGVQMKKQEMLRRNSMSVTPFTSRFQKLIVKLGEQETQEKDENDSLANYGGTCPNNISLQPQSFLKAESALENIISKRIVESEKVLEDNPRLKPSPFSTLRNVGGYSDRKNSSAGGGESETFPHNTISLTSVEQKLPISKCFKQYEQYMKQKKRMKNSSSINTIENQGTTTMYKIIGNPMASQAVAVEDIDIATSREVLKIQDDKIQTFTHNEDVLSSHSSSYSRHNQPLNSNGMKNGLRYVFEERQVIQPEPMLNRNNSTSISLQLQ